MCPDLDLEHTLDAISPGEHRVQVWSQSSHFSRRLVEAICAKSLQTDGRTDDGCRAIVLAHELIIKRGRKQARSQT